VGNKRTWFSRFLQKDPAPPKAGASPEDEKPVEPPPDGMLLIVSGRMAGRSFSLKPGKTYTGGRSSQCAFCLTEEGVSRTHFTIEAKGETYVLSDLGSSNGTFVNERPAKQVVLQNRDRIRVGATEMQFNLKASTRPASTASATHSLDETTLRRRIEEDHIGESPGRAHEMLRTLYKVGNVINSESDGEKIFSAIIDCVFDIFEANRAFLLLYDADTGLFERVAGRSPEGDQKELNLSKTILLESVKKGLSILSTDTMHDKRFKTGESIVLQNIRSAMCVPLEAKKEIIGALYVDNVSIKDAFSEFDLEMLSAMGKQAGIALMKLKLAEENARLFYSAIRTSVRSMWPRRWVSRARRWRT
jgi:adenylate cyclase